MVEGELPSTIKAPERAAGHAVQFPGECKCGPAHATARPRRLNKRTFKCEPLYLPACNRPTSQAAPTTRHPPRTMDTMLRTWPGGRSAAVTSTCPPANEVPLLVLRSTGM